MVKPNGIVFYDGPSMIDGKRIVGIATARTDNRKTGDMIQTWILRAQVDPLEALRTGKDRSICGSCYHRGDPETGRPRTCYVTVAQAPLGVWRKWKRKGYQRMTMVEFVDLWGKPLRLGAYGDPTAIPLESWGPLHRTPHTGYTHQWGYCDERWKQFVMASCETADQERIARLAGWRTFRTLPAAASPSERTIECLSESAGKSCASCLLCSGKRPAPSIWIRAHGTAKEFVR